MLKSFMNRYAAFQTRKGRKKKKIYKTTTTTTTRKICPFEFWLHFVVFWSDKVLQCLFPPKSIKGCSLLKYKNTKYVIKR